MPKKKTAVEEKLYQVQISFTYYTKKPPKPELEISFLAENYGDMRNVTVNTYPEDLI